MADLIAADGLGLVPFAIAIALALGALWEPSVRASTDDPADGSVRNSPARPDGSPLASR